MKKKQKIKLLFIFLVLFLLGTGFVFALEINYPKVPGALSPQEFLQSASASPEQIPSLYIKYILNLIFWASGIIVLGVLLWAGVRYLTSAGKAETMLTARQQISTAFLGILILLSAFIILNILNPQLLILKLPKVEIATTTERTMVPLPATTTEMTRTAIDTELPLGKVLEDYLFASSTMIAIKKNASNTLDITSKLKEQIDYLKDTVQGCDCGEAKPQCEDSESEGSDQECSSFGNTSGCSSYCTQSCTCDVCADERDDIDSTEEDDLKKLDELKKQIIATKKKDGFSGTIELLKEVKTQLGKLERIERFMKECPMWRVGSLAQFFYDKDFYIAQKWTLRNVQFWEKIIIGEDWVTLYCPVSGTILGEMPSITAASTTLELPPVEPPSAEEQMACTTKIPVGEIIDRAKRIANRLINRLETLIDLDRQMAQAVDEMHVLVSKCSSQQPRCCSLCIKVKGVCVVHKCIKMTGACPFDDIDKKADQIATIQGEIEETITDEDEKNIGIIPLTDKDKKDGIFPIIPKFLEDLNKIIRRPLKECITDIPAESAVESTEVQVILSDCESSVRAVGPEGVVIQKCCLEEKEFKDCLQGCYLKSGQDYEKCLQDCLKGTNNEEISICNHRINFYCCGL